MSLGDRLGLAGVILALLAIATPYLWPDKRWIGWLSLSGALVLLGVWASVEVWPHAVAAYHSHPTRTTSLVFVTGGCLAVLVWWVVIGTIAQFGPSATNQQTEKITKTTASRLQLERIDLFQGQSLVAPEKKLSFRISFKNYGPQLVHEPRLIVVNSLAEIPNLQQYHMLMDTLKQSAQSMRANPPTGKAPDVGIGQETWVDVTIGPLEKRQARGLLKGSVRLYFYMWAQWVGDDGIDGHTDVCLWLPTPNSAQLVAENVRHWNACSPPQ